MKKRLLLLHFVVALFTLSAAMSQKMGTTLKPAKVPEAARLLDNGTAGRDFWLTVPPNEVSSYPRQLHLEVYIASTKDTKGYVEIPSIGYKRPFLVKGMQITTLSTVDGTASWNWELDEDADADRVSSKGIHIVADDPVCIYVLNPKDVTSDGYLALPTQVWGNEYMHLAYYDNNEGGGRDLGGGFCVMASENNTRLVINVKSNIGGIGTTYSGKKNGDVVNVTLNKGQVYMMRGSGTSPQGQYDISGTKVVSSKPVGFISFHMRTAIPTISGSSRDHISEMLLPISAWGKKYVTVELERKNRGDMFRIIASEPNTNWSMKYYDKNTGEQLGMRSGVLRNAGDFYEEVGKMSPLSPNRESIRGTSVWEADKPVLLMQYSYSAAWDNASDFDPFMFWVVPVEQFTKGTLFQTPSNVAFQNNFFNVIVKGDTNDPTKKKLRSVLIDGKPLYIQDTKYLNNRIPNTDMWWGTIRMDPGAHYLEGDAPFGGYIYGFATFASYGWPAATAVNKINELDTVPPALTRTENCGVFIYRATELVDGLPSDTPRQIDQGISKVELLDNKYDNYRLVYIDNLDLTQKVATFRFRLEVINPKIPGYAYFTVLDRRGNVTLDSVFYNPELLTLNPKSVAFGNVRVTRSVRVPITIENPTDSTINVTVLKLKGLVGGQTGFRIVTALNLPFSIPAKGSFPIEIEFAPTEEKATVDTLISASLCGEYVLGTFSGRGVMPKIQVADLNIGPVIVGEEKCNTLAEYNSGRGLSVRNFGSDTLTVTGFVFASGEFTMSTPLTPSLPTKIAPGQEATFKTICYKPNGIGADEQDVTIQSDAMQGDSISNWRAEGIKPGPSITPFDFGGKRVLSTNTEGVHTITNVDNSGAGADLNVASVKLEGLAGANFQITGTLPASTKQADGSWQFSPAVVLRPNQGDVKVFVQYIPQTESIQPTDAHVDNVVASFSGASAPAAIKGEVRGRGWLPKISAQGFRFASILIATKSTEIGKVMIENPSQTHELAVREVRWKNGFGDSSASRAFSWVTGQTLTNFVIPIGGTKSFDVEYFSRADENLDSVEIFSDAVTGDKNPLEVRTAVAVSGPAERQRLDVFGYDFKANLTCDNPQGTVRIYNPNNAPVQVTSLTISGADAGDFVLDNVMLPQTLQANGEFVVKVTFLPKDGKTSRADVTFGTDAGNRTTQVVGSGYRVAVKFAVAAPTITRPSGETTSKANPFDVVSFPIVYSGSDKEAAVREFKAVLTFPADGLKLRGNVRAESGAPGWTFTQTVTPGKVEITASSATTALAAGKIATLEFDVFMTDSSTFPMNLAVANSSIGVRAECVSVSAESNSVNLGEFCVRDLRNVVLGGQFGLMRPTPNPVISVGEIGYSVGFDVPVTIEMVSPSGVVTTLVNGERKAGEYRIKIETRDLASGIYVVRMKAGAFEAVEKLSITR